MPWDEADRGKYEVIRDRYSTDMSDAEFELISRVLPAPKKLGPKPTDLRVVGFGGDPHFYHGRQTHGQTSHGLHRLAEKMGRRKNTGLDQLRATAVEGFRGDNRILARMVTTGPCFPPHAKARKSENRLRLNFESGSERGVESWRLS